jgi:hypothetical protein
MKPLNSMAFKSLPKWETPYRKGKQC